MKQLVIINFDELEHRFKQGVFQPIEQCITFSELFPLFLRKVDDGEDHKIAVWEAVEHNFNDELECTYYEVFDLMLDMFHETMFYYIRSMLGVALDDLSHEVIHIQGNTVYLKVTDENISKLYRLRSK